MQKRLTKSATDRPLTGLLGGIAEYFDTDPALIRLGYIFLTVFTGGVPGICAYIIGAAIVPEGPITTVVHDDTDSV